MKSNEFLQHMVELSKKQEAHMEFYELAEDYGFCTQHALLLTRRRDAAD